MILKEKIRLNFVSIKQILKQLLLVDPLIQPFSYTFFSLDVKFPYRQSKTPDVEKNHSSCARL